MQVEKLDEAGYAPALLGLHYSFTEECHIEHWMKMFDFEKAQKKSEKLCKMDGGHNKFLEQIQVWLNIRAPLYWWKQFDTYRVGVSKSSKSTMHTIMKRPFKNSDFVINVSLDTIRYLEGLRREGKFAQVNSELSNGYLQTRVVNLNYKTLRNIINQRRGHKLGEWEYFINRVLELVNRPEFLE